MFKRGDIIIWKTYWGSLFLGEIDALFTDKHGVASLHAKCVDDVYGPRGFHFIAALGDCRVWRGPATKTIEHKENITLIDSDTVIKGL